MGRQQTTHWCCGKDQGCLANNLQWWIKAINQMLWAVRRPASCRNGGAALGFGCRNFKAQLWETKFLPIMINSNINRAKVKKYEMICEQDSYSLKNIPKVLILENVLWQIAIELSKSSCKWASSFTREGWVVQRLWNPGIAKVGGDGMGFTVGIVSPSRWRIFLNICHKRVSFQSVKSA